MSPTTTLERPRSRNIVESSQTGNPSRNPFWTVYFFPLAVFLAALVLAAVAYGRFLEDSRQLWWSILHDRNAHYFFGQNVALDLRKGDLLGLVHDMDGGGRVWGPLHGLLLGLLLTVGGVDYRLGVLPSLAAWVGAAVFAFLAARRATPRGGNLAGCVAALFFLASPAHSAFSTDIMLEGLGAFLSLLILYLYLVSRQETALWPGRCLGLALTALFLHKYNYWMLVVFGLVAAQISAHPRTLGRFLAANWQEIDWRAWLGRQLRHPLTYPIVALFLLVALFPLWGGQTVAVGKWHISMHNVHNLLHAAYVLLFVRLLPWWWRSGRTWVGRLHFRNGQLVYWHLWPVAVWFLWPKRLSYFIQFVFPTTNMGETPQPMWPGGWNFYWDCFTTDFHLGLWSAGLALGLIAGLLSAGRKFRPGGAALVWFVVLATVIAVHHPNRKSRFLHSWIAGTWVLAGAGLAHLLYGRATASAARWRSGLAALAVGGLAALHLPGLLEARASPEGGLKPDRPCALDLTDCYLPYLADARRPTILSNRPLKFFTSWTYQDYYQHRGRLTVDLKGFGDSPAANRQAFARWLEKTDWDALVFIDIPKGGHFFEDAPYPNFDQVPELLAGQKVFTLSRRWEFPQFRGGAVSLWKREKSEAVIKAN